MGRLLLSCQLHSIYILLYREIFGKIWTRIAFLAFTCHVTHHSLKFTKISSIIQISSLWNRWYIYLHVYICNYFIHIYLFTYFISTKTSTNVTTSTNTTSSNCIIIKWWMDLYYRRQLQSKLQQPIMNMSNIFR